MKVLCTMPGRFGDIMWSLPTVRAIAQHIEEKVDLMVGAGYGSLTPLIQEQFYIDRCVSNLDWVERPDGGPAPFTPYRPPYANDHFKTFFPADSEGNITGEYDKIIHLGYQQWPQNFLAYEIYLSAVGQWGADLPSKELLTLDEPWIQAPILPLEHHVGDVLICWSDEWAELKMGVSMAVDFALFKDWEVRLLRHPGSRYFEWPFGSTLDNLDWMQTAAAIGGAKVILTCLSSQWVLANAMGKPVVIMEPAEARHNPIFYYDTPRNHLVLGNDGKPTFDARAVVDAMKKELAFNDVYIEDGGGRR